MSGHVDNSELPDLSDEGRSNTQCIALLILTCADIELLHIIVTTADTLPFPPYKSLFRAYDQILEENNISPDHDGIIFRALLRIGEHKDGAMLMDKLNAVLEAAGIEIHPLESQEGGPSGDLEPDATKYEPEAKKANPTRRHRRRVSFDDARLDETWLSQHSSSLRSLSTRNDLDAGLFSRGSRRARSSSSQRHPVRSNGEHANYETRYTSEDAFPMPSEEDLEANAEVFLETSTMRASRRILHHWHDVAVAARAINEQAYRIAKAHDQRVLRLQALATWRAVAKERVWNRKHEEHVERLDKRAEQARKLMVLGKAFTHWATHSRDHRVVTEIARRHMLRIRYFHRWKAYTQEQAAKSRTMLLKKHLNKWRSSTARALVREEQALAHYEETLVNRTFWDMFWTFCARQAPLWRADKLKRRYLSKWMANCRQTQQLDLQACERYEQSLKARSMAALQGARNTRNQDNETAARLRRRQLLGSCLTMLTVQLRLKPLGRQMTLRVDLTLMRKAFTVWSSHALQLRKAASVDERRLLQQTWTKWNDSLRIHALAQRIDERVLLENLYRWVLAERMRLFKRTSEAHLLQRVMTTWRTSTAELAFRSDEASYMFAQRQDRRLLLFGMQHLHAHIWLREELDRRAVEFRNSRLLPTVMDAWKSKTASTRQLHTWAADANFYRLTHSTLQQWQKKSTQHQKTRKRNAYIAFRAKMKIRLVRDVFTTWRTRAMEVTNMQAEADARLFDLTQRIGAASFNQWRASTRSHLELEEQAEAIDHERLLQSAVAALLSRSEELAEMENMAVAFQTESDETLVLQSLKRMQWRCFTIRRLNESSAALMDRNRDQHLRLMLRSWARQSAARRTAEDPPSPSLRPASRSAARSAPPPPQRDTLYSPPRPETTPAYLRTPSRSRRAARFRPLPTPAPMTPFNLAYAVTTPAPLTTTGIDNLESMTPQVTPFSRKLRAAGVTPGPSALRGSVLGRSFGTGGGAGTTKSVRFSTAGRFGSARVRELDES